MTFALLNMGAVFLIFGFQRYGDSIGLLDTISWLADRSGFEAYPLILRPLGPFLAIPFEFIGRGAGLIVQNIAFYLLSAFLIFKIAEIIYDNPFDKLPPEARLARGGRARGKRLSFLFADRRCMISLILAMPEPTLLLI